MCMICISDLLSPLLFFSYIVGLCNASFLLSDAYLGCMGNCRTLEETNLWSENWPLQESSVECSLKWQTTIKKFMGFWCRGMKGNMWRPWLLASNLTYLLEAHMTERREREEPILSSVKIMTEACAKSVLSLRWRKPRWRDFICAYACTCNCCRFHVCQMHRHIPITVWLKHILIPGRKYCQGPKWYSILCETSWKCNSWE